MDVCEQALSDITNLQDLRTRLVEDYNVATKFDGWPAPNWFVEELAEIDKQLDELYRFIGMNCEG